MNTNIHTQTEEMIEDQEDEAPLGWDFYWQEFHSGNTGKLSTRRDEDSIPDSEKVTAPLELF